MSCGVLQRVASIWLDSEAAATHALGHSLQVRAPSSTGRGLVSPVASLHFGATVLFEVAPFSQTLRQIRVTALEGATVRRNAAPQNFVNDLIDKERAFGEYQCVLLQHREFWYSFQSASERAATSDETHSFTKARVSHDFLVVGVAVRILSWVQV